MSWPLVKLGELVKVKGGKRLPKGSGYSESKTAYPYIRVTDFKNNSVRNSGLVYIEKEIQEKIARYTISCDDVYISIAGTIGIVGIIPEHLDGANLTENAAKLVINNKGQLDKNYLVRFLSTAGQTQIHERKKTTSQPKLALFRIEEVEIPLPPLDEQKRIAAILDKADAIRRKRQQAIQLADDFLRSVFLDMFGDPVLNPKGLPQVKLTELSDVISGYAFKSAEYIDDGEDSVRLCRGANTLTGYFDWKDTVYWNKEKLAGIQNYKIKSGDVILAMDRPWISSGLKVCVFPENERDTYLVQRVARIRPKNPKYTDFLYASILSKAFEKHCCPTETTVPHISPVELKNFNVLVPDEKLVEKYHDAVVKVRKFKLAMQKSAVEASNAFNSLSQKSFAGEL